MGKKSEKLVPAKMEQVYESVVAITDDFCGKHLNEEYAELCREMAGVLCRMRPSPLLKGRINIWAAGIIYTLGRVNFLFDKTQKPHMRADELCSLLGVSQSSASAKSSQLWKILDLIQLDPRWCLPSRLADNPLAWLIEVNGMIVDVRWLPREIQEEAYRRGMIPFLPEARPNN
jgi:hypothetical protein